MTSPHASSPPPRPSADRPPAPAHSTRGTGGPAGPARTAADTEAALLAASRETVALLHRLVGRRGGDPTPDETPVMLESPAAGPPFAAASFAAVVDAVRQERAYQRKKWGYRWQGVLSPAMPEHLEIPRAVGDYLTFMRYHLGEADRLLSTATDPAAALAAVRKVATLGVACLEVHGCPPRDPAAPATPADARTGRP